MIDVRVRAIVGLPPEQCAYRTCFGTETELLRLSILFQYCKHRNIPIFVGFLDREQAFERAWRVGILYQLWMAGVRGKCWRVIAHFLKNVKAVVRTNYGDSKTFVLREGVLQGTVLAAILFIIFLNPLIAALKPFCSKLNGLTLSPYLFADDLTLLALSRKCREKLIELTILWTKRWKSSIKRKIWPPDVGIGARRTDNNFKESFQRIDTRYPSGGRIR